MNPLQMIKQVFGGNPEDGSDSETDNDSEESVEDGSEFSEFSSSEEETGSPSEKSQSEHDLYRFQIYQFKEVGPIVGRSPKPRSGHRIVYYKGKIYSFGGFNPAIDENDPEMVGDVFWQESKPLFKELWCLNLNTRRWTKCEMKGDIPEQLASHTAVAHPTHPGLMLVYGGTGAPFGLTTSNTVVACQLDTQQFIKLATDPGGGGHPMPLYGQAVITDQTKGLFYTVGGTSGFHYFMDVNMLDLTSSPAPVWRSLYTLSGAVEEPEPRYRHELCLFKDHIYVLGGGTSFSANRFEVLPTFNILERRWFYTKTKPDPAATIDNSDDGYPEARRCHGTVQLGDEAWVIGGYDGDEVYGDAWKLDLTHMQWTRLRRSLPLPVYFHAVTTTEEGKLVMFGGVDSLEQNTRTNRVFTAWLKVPSLRAMAWEALTHYNPDLVNLSSSRLLAEGIPQDCLEMLSRPTSRADCG